MKTKKIIILLILTGFIACSQIKDDKWNFEEAVEKIFIDSLPQYAMGYNDLTIEDFGYQFCFKYLELIYKDTIEGSKLNHFYSFEEEVFEKSFYGLYSGNPQGYYKFYKRLMPLENIEILIFYNKFISELDEEHVLEIATIERKSRRIIDRINLLTGGYKEGYFQYKMFKIDAGYIISQKRYWAVEDSPEIIELPQKYQIKNNGKIVRYFNEENGINSKGEVNDYFYEKGSIKNHYKEGLWEEKTFDVELYKAYGYEQVIGVGNYVAGERTGEWKFYEVREDFNDYEPDLTRIYKNNPENDEK